MHPLSYFIGGVYVCRLYTVYTLTISYSINRPVLGMTLNCIDIFIVTGSFLYWCVMRPASQRFFIHSCIYLRILIISYLATSFGTNSLSVLMCRKEVNQIKLNKKVIQNLTTIFNVLLVYQRHRYFMIGLRLLSSCSYVACRHSWVRVLNLFRSVCGFLLQQIVQLCLKMKHTQEHHSRRSAAPRHFLSDSAVQFVFNQCHLAEHLAVHLNSSTP